MSASAGALARRGWTVDRLAGSASEALRAVRERPRHLLLAALVAGLLTAGHGWGAIVTASALLAALAGRPLLAVAVAVLALGAAAGAHARLRALDATTLRPLLGRTLSARATLLEQPRPSLRGRRALAELQRRGRPPERVLLLFFRPLPSGAGEGDVLSLQGRLSALGPRQSDAVRRGAHAAVLVSTVRAAGLRRGGFAGVVDGVRRHAEGVFESGLSPPRAALMRGMVLGDATTLGTSATNDFRRSGLTHLLAASGANIALLAALALPLLAAAGLARTPRYLAVLALIAFYVPLAGGGASIQRAGVMAAAGVAAVLSGRPTARWYALGLAAAVTLALDPRADGDPGWQLSFAAVAGILLLAPRMTKRLVERRVPEALAAVTAVTVAATLATAPILSVQFGQVSLAALPANLIAAPLVAPITWLGALAAVAAQIAPALATPFVALASAPLALLSGIAHVAAAVPGASLSIRAPSAPVAALAYLALGAIVVSPRVRTAAAVAATASLGAALGRPPPAPAAAPVGLRVSFLDIGQGDATLAQDGGHAILVDTGPPGGPVLARLRAEGIKSLDLLVVTHGQIDHDGEAADVVRAFPVGAVLDGEDGVTTPEHRALLAAAAARRTQILTPDAGEVLHAGSLTLRILWPHREPAADHAGADPNQRAIVAELQDRGVSLLLTADAESDVTAPLLDGPVDVLKVAHHGSADVGLPAELAVLHPRVAVIEVGAHNTYGHPTPTTLAALRAAGVRVYRTDRDGTVRVDAPRAGALAVTAGADR